MGTKKIKEVEKARKAMMKDLKAITAIGTKLEAIDSTSSKFTGLIDKLIDADANFSTNLDDLRNEMAAAKEDMEDES